MHICYRCTGLFPEPFAQCDLCEREVCEPCFRHNQLRVHLAWHEEPRSGLLACASCVRSTTNAPAWPVAS